METNQPEAYRRYRRYFVDLSHFYQKRQARVYTGIVLSILTVAFFLVFAIRPTLVTIAGLLKEIKDKKVIAEKLEDKINALNSAQIEYQRIEDDLYLVDEALPTKANVSFLLRQLETLAKKNNISFDSLQFGATTLKGKERTAKTDIKETEKRETNPKADFSLAGVGDYHQLKAFLDTLIRLRRLVLVDTFAFQTGKEGERLILNIDAGAYYLTKEQ